MTDNDPNGCVTDRLLPKLLAAASFLEQHGAAVPEELEKAIAFTLQVGAQGGSQGDFDALETCDRGFNAMFARWKFKVLAGPKG